MKILSIYSFKGGVGKTSTAINMAWFSADSGLRTLLIDLDPQGAASYCFRIKGKKKEWVNRFFKRPETLLSHIKGSDFDDLDLVPANLSFRQFDIELSGIKKPERRLKNLLNDLEPFYDLIVLDCPPSISLLSESVFYASDLIVVPVIPNPLSERPLYQLYDFFDKKNLPKQRIIPFFSMVQSQKTVHTQCMQRMRLDISDMLKTQIPFCSDVEKMAEYRAPVAGFAANRPVFSYYNKLWSEIRERMPV